MHYRGEKIRSYFDTLRLHLRLVCALQRVGGDSKCFIHRAGDSIQIDLCKVVNRSLHLAFWGTQNDTTTNPRLNVCTSLADSCSSSQATTAREVEGRSGWGLGGRRVRQTAVAGSLKRLTICYRELEVAC